MALGVPWLPWHPPQARSGKYGVVGRGLLLRGQVSLQPAKKLPDLWTAALPPSTGGDEIMPVAAHQVDGRKLSEIKWNHLPRACMRQYRRAWPCIVCVPIANDLQEERHTFTDLQKYLQSILFMTPQDY
jgi:hypothetical protein